MDGGREKPGTAPRQKPATRHERAAEALRGHLAAARTGEPEVDRVVDLLLAPVLAGRRLDAPVPALALADIARGIAAKGLSDEALAAAVRRIRTERAVTVRTSDFEAAAIEAGLDVVREAQRQSRLEALPEIAVDAAATERFQRALLAVASPEHVETWFRPAGVVRVEQAGSWTRVVIATVHRPGMVAQFGASYGTAAARAAFGAQAAVEFVQGRPATGGTHEA